MTTAPAETFITAMYNVVGDQIAQGNCAAAIERLDTFIESIEDNDAKSRNNFGTNLVVLYSMRAKLLFEAGDLCGLPAKVELAQKDVARAEARLSEFYGSMDDLQKGQLRTQIRGVISPDASVRAASLEAVMQWKGYHPVATSERLAALAKDHSAPVFAQSKVGRLLIPFLVGALVWALPVIIIATILKLSPGGTAQGLPAVLIFVMLAVFLVDIFLAYEGWDWLSGAPFGSSQGALKWMALVLILATFVGIPLVMYWSGKKLLYALGIPYFS